nr:hypothetical protein [Tanacetum cinerariifolium]
ALTVNSTIYVSCIKQFWSSVSVKKVNDVIRLQALIDNKKVIITEDTVHEALHLDDAESIDCLPNEEIFTELARMGYEKHSTKLTFYKAFFSAQWNLVRNVDSSLKFYMYPRFLQLMIAAQVGKGFSEVNTPLFDGMLVPQHAADDVDDVVVDNVPANDVAGVVANDVIAGVVAHAAAEPTLPSPTPTTTPPPPQQEVTSTPPPSPYQSPEVREEEKAESLWVEKIEEELLDADEDVTLEEVDAAKDADVQGRLEESQAQVYHIDLEHADKVLTPSAAKRRKWVVIRDPEETTTPSTIVHSEPKAKDKGKGILVEEPKHLKK